MLKAHRIELLEHVFEQVNLPLISRREVCMAAFGAVRQIPGTIPGKEGLSQSRSWRNHAYGPFGNSLTLVDRLDIAGPEDRNGVSDGLEAVSGLPNKSTYEDRLTLSLLLAQTKP